MAVDNGQPANKDTFNDAFVSRTVDSSTVGKLSLSNVEAESGPEVDNAQASINLALTNSETAINDSNATNVQMAALQIEVDAIESDVNTLENMFNTNSPGTMFYIDENGTFQWLAPGTYGQILQITNVSSTPIPTWVDFAGGGGGSSMIWTSVEGRNIPAGSSDDFLEFFDFIHTETQYIKAVFTVPSSYIAGNQIKLKGGVVRVNSTDVTKDILIRASSYLFKASNSLEAVNGTLHTSTNAEIAVLANALYGISIGDIDICDATGEMDNVAVAAGDKIVILIWRNLAGETASVQSTVQLLKDSFELSLGD